MLKQGVKSEGECGNGSRLIAEYPARRNGENFFELTADERAAFIWQMDAAIKFFLAKICSGCLSSSFGKILNRLRNHTKSRFIYFSLCLNKALTAKPQVLVYLSEI